MTMCDSYFFHHHLLPWRVLKIEEPYASILEEEAGEIGYAPQPEPDLVPGFKEVEVSYGIFREISKMEVGKHEAALNFLSKYGPLTRPFFEGLTDDVKSSVPIEVAKRWWVEIVALKRAHWLLETLTTDRIDDLIPLCIKAENRLPGRSRIVGFNWPDDLGSDMGPLVGMQMLIGVHGCENDIVFSWKMLAQYINQFTPRHHTLVDFDDVSRQLVEVPFAHSLLQILWRLLKERALRLKPTVRCHYSKCRKPIVSPSRSDTLCCPGSPKCRKGWQRDRERMEREQWHGQKKQG